jgi:succinate dehydrogenase / fumarate reductase, cytochrome b subunit
LLRKKKIYDFGYHRFLGSWAWILHRLSGLALIFYLSMHIWVINTLTQGEERFETVMAFLRSTPFKLLEIGLWGVILFHAFNGIRVVLVDFFSVSKSHKKIFAVLIVLGVLLWAAGSWIIISHM